MADWKKNNVGKNICLTDAKPANEVYILIFDPAAESGMWPKIGKSDTVGFVETIGGKCGKKYMIRLSRKKGWEASLNFGPWSGPVLPLHGSSRGHHHPSWSERFNSCWRYKTVGCLWFPDRLYHGWSHGGLRLWNSSLDVCIIDDKSKIIRFSSRPKRLVFWRSQVACELEKCSLFRRHLFVTWGWWWTRWVSWTIKSKVSGSRHPTHYGVLVKSGIFQIRPTLKN